MVATRIYIGLGANIPGPAGPPRATLEAALARLEAAGVGIAKRSRWYRSPAWPDPSDPVFVNAVVEVETGLSAGALLELLHKIEAELGRARPAPNAPRAIDLDLLDYKGVVEADPAGPILPHPRLHLRAFVLLPLAEIAPDWRHPVSRRLVGELIAALPPDAAAKPLE
ncbi:MAG TPA: 2-amino-4-hydroxy-6-hydroxymethyldihydropteridine diphosphokinase [Alphaproteobacteria bacterium]|jgi:2-amino-4-hydroxy-6-hydroxymethyldihydropteridine diphosphokinase